MLKKIIFFILITSCFSLLAEQENPGAKKILNILFINQKVKIDGILNEEFYSTLLPAGDFIQFHPKNGEKPAFKTQVYAYYDKKNIYFAFKCFDDEPAKITADITPFAEYENNDEVLVYLDTFNDKRTYESFAVNPKGIKSGKKTVWDADAKITAYGWCAEIKIPFKSLRFPVKKVQQWAVNFKREIFRLHETDYWTRVERDKMNVFGATFGSMEGIQNIKGGKNIEIFPYAGVRNSYSGDEKDNKFAYGVDLKYGITSNLTLDLTSSPDYSEVESDPFFYQLEPFEVSLAENRPFYNEGSGYFQTHFDLFYSRRITNPTLAAKITGKEKGYSLGLLTALNEDGDDKNFHGVFRLKKDIFKLSHIGMIYSSLEAGDTWNRNIGFDFNFKFKGIYRVVGDAAFSYNKDRPRSDNGMYRLWLVRSVDRGFSFVGTYERKEPNVYVPAGFITNVDYKWFRTIWKYAFRWEGKWVEKLDFNIWKNNRDSISSHLKVMDTYDFIMRMSTKNRVDLTLSHMFGKTRVKILNEDSDLVYDNILYPIKVYYAGLSYNGSRRLQYGIDLVHVEDFVYEDDFTGTKEGEFNNISMWSNLKISPQLQWRLQYEKTGYHSLDDTIEFTGSLLSTKLNYQVNNKISSFLKFQYDSYLRRFQYDFLLGYEPANVSRIYLSIKNYSENRFRLFSPDARSISFKISYLLRI